jgi:hypothetical protein
VGAGICVLKREQTGVQQFIVAVFQQKAKAEFLHSETKHSFCILNIKRRRKDEQ